MSVPPSIGQGEPVGLPPPGEPDALSATAAAGRLNPPAAGTAELVRPRLHEALTTAVGNAPLTVITGPTGSGKTVLAAAWARAQGPNRVAWLSAGPIATGSPQAFWGAVITALRRAGVPLGVLETPVPGRRLPLGLIVRLAAQLSLLPRPVVLVVDHADTLTRREVLDDLDLLAGHVRTRLRLVLLGRADPLLPLARQRVAGQLAEIRTDDLAFRPAEVRALLRRLGIPVTTANAGALAVGTGGSAVALPLVAALVRRGVPADRLAAAIVENDESAVSYLLGQVLERLPGSVRGVLLRAALAPELWPGLVSALTNRHDAARILDWLAVGNACVERAPGAPGGLRIPSLLRELLAAELASTDPEGYADAHRAAADWYAAAAHWPVAVTHAVAIGDWGAVATLLVEDLAVAALLARSGPPEADLLVAAEPELRGADAVLLRAAARAGLTDRGGTDELAFVDVASPEGPDRPVRRASATLLEATAALATDEHPDRTLAAIDAAEAEVTALVSARPERRAECAAVLATMRSSALLATDAGVPLLINAARTAEQACAAADTDRLRAGRVADLALLLALAGWLRQADALVADYLALCESYGVPGAIRSPAAATAAAWVCAEWGEAAAARRWAARAAEAGDHRRAVYTTPLLAVLEARRRRFRGQLDDAEQILGGVRRDRLPRWVREQVVSEDVRLRFARGDALCPRPLEVLPGTSSRAAVLRATAAALGLAAGPRELPETVGTGVLPVTALEARLVQAGLLATAGDTAAAAAVVGEALRMAEPGRLRRPFFDAPPAVLRLLHTDPALAVTGGWLFTVSTPAPARRDAGRA